MVEINRFTYQILCTTKEERFAVLGILHSRRCFWHNSQYNTPKAIEEEWPFSRYPVVTTLHRRENEAECWGRVALESGDSVVSAQDFIQLHSYEYKRS